MPDRRPSVLVTHWVHPEVVAMLEDFASTTVPERGCVFSRHEAVTLARDADALIACMADHVDEAFLAECRRLRIVAATLKGYDNFDATACERHGVWLTVVPDDIIGPTAELAIGLALNVLRRLGEANLSMRQSDYLGWRPTFFGTSLVGSTVGILGMGALGQAIARQLRGFEPSILYYDERTLAQEDAEVLGVSHCRPSELMTHCDVVFVALPLTPATNHFVDRDLIALMGPTSVLINIGRGSVVDEDAVTDALYGDRIAGYAADVFAMEDWARSQRPRTIPPALRDHPRAMLTPHLGSAVDSVRKLMSLTAARQVRQALDGQRPDHAVNDPRERGPR